MSGQIKQLKVADNEKDIGLGIAQIGLNLMQELQLSSGEFVQILGKRRTVAKCVIDKSQDKRQEDVIRIDGVIRNNAGVFLDDYVTIRKIRSVTAKNVVLCPLQPIPPYESEENYCLYLADLLRGIPMIEYDCVAVPYYGGKLFFQVVGLDSIEFNVNDITFVPDAATKFVMETRTVPKDIDIDTIAIGQKANLVMDYGMIVHEGIGIIGITMRFSILYAELVDGGEFEIIPQDVHANDFKDVFSRCKLLAERIIREFNSRIGQENIPKDQRAAMLAEIKSAIMDKWRASHIDL